ncbi:MAG: hypothetical protein FJX74_12390 [Armatimonadetes bacterium]|nr:hypothetical protein [Armatimonadota bacterium]
MGDSIVPHDFQGEFVPYQSEDGVSRVQVRLADESVWLTQRQMAELFQTTKQNVSFHIGNVFREGELAPEATVKAYLVVAREGTRMVHRLVDHHNLEVILAVGYRVRLH